MKWILFLMTLLLAIQVQADEMKVLQADNNKNLVAFEAVNGKVADFRVGSELVLRFPSNETCAFPITKIVPEKSRLFASTAKCSSRDLLVKNTILKSEEQGSFAINEESEPDAPQASTNTSGLPTINESWYTYWGIGATSIDYPSALEASTNQLAALSGVDRTRVGLDLFGFYWPLEDKQTMVGFVMNAAYDMYEVGLTELSIDQYTYSLSGMKFFGPNIGSEWFLRGDIGIAKYAVEAIGSNLNVRATSASGYGILAGGGYAFALGSETRLLVNLNYARRSVESEVVSTTALTLGFLF